ncbi:unnamed protein product [Candida verbasci]|uniref:C2H2-type domain-containing protein n=1 Tax=Candida verbasci TaxID=1227364 RepID=A0A9W4TZ38_9ASCO|nr:unnamed protein product [Candida verbasci]
MINMSNKKQDKQELVLKPNSISRINTFKYEASVSFTSSRSETSSLSGTESSITQNSLVNLLQNDTKKKANNDNDLLEMEKIANKNKDGKYMDFYKILIVNGETKRECLLCRKQFATTKFFNRHYGRQHIKKKK